MYHAYIWRQPAISGVQNELYCAKTSGTSHIIRDARLAWRGAAAPDIKNKNKCFFRFKPCGKGGGFNQAARQSTGNLTNDKIDGRKVVKGGIQKGRQAAEDAANDAIASAMAEGEIIAPDFRGEGTTPEHEPAAAAA